MSLGLISVYKSYGDRKVLENFTLSADPGSITCLFGPSGCGKTTLLNLMGGIVKPDAGTIEGFPQEKKSYIFQETRILPWKTVHQNIVFPLLDLMPRKEAMDHARSFMSMVGLEKEEHLYPSQLSGGMKQRVSIARAFAYPGTLILMDEAFQNLDSYLKYNILNSFRKIWEMDRRTVIFVTHDIDEALFLGQKIVILGGAPLSTIRIIDNEGSDQQNIKSTILNFLNLP